jgi:multidrug efflux pump subunit AcrB
MKNFVAWFAKNTVAANLVMVILLVGGGLTTMAIKMELFPEFSMDMISVSVAYPGAAPEEVEESICVRIEEEVHNLDGVKKVTSTASENDGTVMIEVLPGYDVRKVLDDVKTRVDAIETFPENAEKPVIQELLMRNQVIFVAISGQASETSLKRLGEKVRDEINTIEGISQVQLASARPYEISIEVSEEALRRHGLSFDDVAMAVRRGSLDLSGGSVKTDSGEVLLRTKGQAYRGAEFENVPLISGTDGTRIRLGEVARVVDGFAETDQSARFNSEPAVLVQVYRVGDENALHVSDGVKDYVAKAQARMPEGITLTTWADAGVFLEGRLNLLTKNGLQGLGLVFLVLALFLRFRLAFWVTLGIPISFMGALWVMPELDQSINMLTLFGFILVLGIVVDDAIVVGESIFSHQKKGGVNVESAIKGAQRVAVPVTFAVLTTIVAFVPMLGLPGMMGKFFKVIPMVVIPTLVFSWIESKVVLPAHLSHSSARIDKLSTYRPFSWWVSFQGMFERGLEWWAKRIYQPSLDFCLRWRYATVAVAISTLFLLFGLIRGDFVKWVFFNQIEGDIVSAQLTMPLGTSVDTTERAVSQIEAAARVLQEELQSEQPAGAAPVVKNYMTAIGEQPFRAQQSNKGIAGASGFSAAHLGEVTMELIGAEERTIGAEAIANRWRELAGPIPGAVELIFSSDVMSAGDAINIQFAGSDVDELREIAESFKLLLGNYDGVYDIADSFRGGKQELRLEILPSAEALGLTLQDLARQVRQGFYGEEAQRIQRGKDDVKVMVRYPEADRGTLHGLETMRVRTPMGDEVPFSSVAKATLDRGYATINRTDRKRTVTVTAAVDKDRASANKVLDEVLGEPLTALLATHPGVGFSREGENREEADTIESMMIMGLLALFAIYALMAVPFKSYLQPLIVMSAIPFGMVGAIVGHMIMGVDLSVLSICGILALAGVVVNDSLVLVDFVNGRRADGLSVIDAARVAGTERFRPILLTSLTTFAGLTPLMLEKSVQAQFLVPMAISLAYGVIFATAITLVIVPSGYLILDDLTRGIRFLFGGPWKTEDEASSEDTGGALPVRTAAAEPAG